MTQILQAIKKGWFFYFMKFNSKAIKLMTATLGATALGVLGVTATAHADEIYTVQSGDTLSEISYKYANDTSMVNTIANKNKISDINFILVGQKLYIGNNGQIKPATKQEIATTPAASQSTSTASQATSTSSAVATPAASSATSTSASAATPASSATTVASSAAASTQPASSAASQTSTATSSVASQATTQRTTSTATSTTSTTSSTTTSGSEAAAKAWIVARESGGSYTASNGQYYGAYQLSKSMLGGDLSAAHQDQVANSYVASRYGSWVNAKSFWMSNGWY